MSPFRPVKRMNAPFSSNGTGAGVACVATGLRAESDEAVRRLADGAAGDSGAAQGVGGPTPSDVGKNPKPGLTSPQEARRRRIASNVKPFIATLRVTNPVRKSWASSRKRVCAVAGNLHCEA